LHPFLHIYIVYLFKKDSDTPVEVDQVIREKTNQYCLTKKKLTRKSRNALKGVGTNF